MSRRSHDDDGDEELPAVEKDDVVDEDENMELLRQVCRRVGVNPEDCIKPGLLSSAAVDSDDDLDEFELLRKIQKKYSIPADEKPYESDLGVVNMENDADRPTQDAEASILFSPQTLNTRLIAVEDSVKEMKVSIPQSVDTRLQAFDTRLQAVEASVEEMKVSIPQSVDTRLQAFDTRLQAIDTRLQAVEASVEEMKVSMVGMQQTMDRVCQQLERMNTLQQEHIDTLSNKPDQSCDISDNTVIERQTSSERSFMLAFEKGNLSKAALAFIDAVKKNRSHQKFIHSTMICLKVRIENKKLRKRFKIFRDFQGLCSQKNKCTLFDGRSLSPVNVSWKTTG